MKKLIKIITYPFVLIYKLILWIIGLFFPIRNVKINFLPDPYFVGSYAKFPVKTVGYVFDDLEFIITEGASGGYISYCRDADFDPAKPDIMICFGYQPGNYHLEVRKKATGTLIRTFDFSIDTKWADEKKGPGLSFTGISENLSFNPAWGGGSATPQNLSVVPAFGVRRIAIILIDFFDARYTTDAPTLTTIRDRWMNEAINGVNNAGRMESSRQYYREVSYNNYDLSASIFGPVNLPNAWSSYFNDDGSPKGAFWQQAVTGCDSTVNYNDFDNLIFVSETGIDSMSNTAYAWPYGGAGTFTTAEGNKNIGVVSMPREWGAAFRPDRSVRSTIVHELGHSIGLGDQYTPETGRNPGNWETMAWENNLSHFSLAHRMMLGWIQAGWLKTYNFATGGGGVVNETISVSPIENGAPSGSDKIGMEIRIADGWNYYVEYRSPQTTQIGDRALDTPDAVLVTDVDSTPGDAPISRPNILLVHNDIDGDGPVLINGSDYKETDNTDPTFPTDFRLSVSGISATKADVKIEYGVNSKPDPAIRPWPASVERQWQSPDIEVQNVRNLADPTNWFNVPWAGHANNVIAKVKNNGNLNAPDVRVEFYVKNYTVGGSPETFLGQQTLSIPALATVDFTTSWNPPGDGHYCIIVKIPGYITPGPTPVLEMSIFNNLAQSNYDRFISASASPATREITQVEVGNPYDKPTRVFIRPGQTNPLYRTYVEHTSLYLAPSETKMVKLMFEYDPQFLYKIPVSLGKTDHLDLNSQDKDKMRIREVVEKYNDKPNKVGVVSYIDNPSEEHPHTPTRLGGVDAEVITGKKTRFERFVKEGNNVTGGVVTVDGKQRVNSGKIIFIKKISDGKDTFEENEIIDLTQGTFNHHLKESEKGELVSVQAYYLPALGFSDCYSDVRK
ncbi:MAG: CARDB domain-containing protein [Dysgonamonadaceae bacterium]